jgi:hypothetical protein
MSKKKSVATCKACESSNALYIHLTNGSKIPNYVMRIGEGIYCKPCAEKVA